MLSTQARWAYRAVAVGPAFAFAATVTVARAHHAPLAPELVAAATSAVIAWSGGWALFLWLGLINGDLSVHRAFAFGYRLALIPQVIGLFLALIYWRKAKS